MKVSSIVESISLPVTVQHSTTHPRSVFILSPFEIRTSNNYRFIFIKYLKMTTEMIFGEPLRAPQPEFRQERKKVTPIWETAESPQTDDKKTFSASLKSHLSTGWDVLTAWGWYVLDGTLRLVWGLPSYVLRNWCFGVPQLCGALALLLILGLAVTAQLPVVSAVATMSAGAFNSVRGCELNVSIYCIT
ncbi:hypothetical protein F5Y18DRAFT_412513 [Xylariaceae sp. FL1019]|nr:hypothetical protein F5Y18DRAFT_412513 [Xylariaceae sp. FL1019]